MQNYASASNGNPQLILSEIRSYQKELDKLREGLLSNYFSPDEIRGIIDNIRDASRKIGERASSVNMPLVLDLARKLEELTQVMLAKSTWDRRFGTSGMK
jgi:hypothetical protein